MKLSIIVCATKSYTYAMRAQARRVASALRLAGIDKAHVAIVGDTSNELAAVAAYWKAELGCEIDLIADKRFVEGTSENYKAGAQLLIADMRTAAHAAARRADADWCWSLDSDTLPQPNALRTLLDTCRFDGGFYSVAMCPYPNTAFLGGFGTPQNPIAEDFLPYERVLPDDLKKTWEENDAALKAWTAKERPADLLAIRDELQKQIKACPPDGNVFQVNGKHGWRRRGWLDSAYPGIGHGSMVPTDWVGFGCTLMNRQALALAHFEGYEGQGTEDLFIGWHRWIPAGLRMAVLPHCPADHVIWEKKKGGADGVYTLHHVYHEQLGECQGHLRVKQLPWRAE
ncbi:MAG: hypothetical protein K0R17_1023 [Rariglobus sp.]|jgi:hypothetical protein|nr:hypothetical protein [Rariglobus sp.]